MPEKAANHDLEQTVLSVLVKIVEDVSSVIPGYMELVVHDFSKLPNSVVAVAGKLTERKVGSPPTNLLLQDYAKGVYGTSLLAYKSTLPDGRVLNSSSVLVKVGDKSIGAVCVNVDMSIFTQAATALAQIFPALEGLEGIDTKVQTTTPVPEQALGVGEIFPHTLDELLSELIRASIESVGIPVDLMRKQHKKAVVQDMHDRGMFAIKNSVDAVAAALQVTRFTVYNYLNEIDDEGKPPA